MITEPPQAEEILQNAQADAIFMARELGAEIEYIAKQYGCAIDLRKAESAGKNQKVKNSKDKKVCGLEDNEIFFTFSKEL